MKFNLIKKLLIQPIFTILLLMLLLGSLSTVCAEPVRSLETRVDRLERLMGSQKQLELLYRLKQLQEENQQLRAMLEEQSHEVRLIKKQQRELYADLNRRMGQMEGGQKSSQESHEPVVVSPSVIDRSTIAAQTVAPQKVTAQKYAQTQREEITVNDNSHSKSLQFDKTTTRKPTVATIKPMSEKESKAEQKAYQSAYDELRARRYNKSRDSFIKFIEQYPNGRYAHIAQYWVAESSYAQSNYQQAISDYQRLLDVYPFSPKKAEAELKKAYCYYELGDKKKARRTVDQLLINYPESTEAGQAKRLLNKL